MLGAPLDLISEGGYRVKRDPFRWQHKGRTAVINLTQLRGELILLKGKVVSVDKRDGLNETGQIYEIGDEFVSLIRAPVRKPLAPLPQGPVTESTPETIAIMFVDIKSYEILRLKVSAR